MATNKQYNLEEIYGGETRLQKYIRLSVGEGATFWQLFWHELIMTIFPGVPGALGLIARHWLYRKLFQGFHAHAYVGKQVLLRCPRSIYLSSGVLIDDYVQLVASSRHEQSIKIGSNSFIRSYAMLNAGPPDGFIHIGNNSSIGQGTILYGNGGLTIGDNVMIAGQCFIVASSHIHDNPNLPISRQGFSASGITIEDNVWVGAGAKILDGVTIGSGAIIGANAVVNRSVAPKAKVGGIPARVLTMEDEKD